MQPMRTSIITSFILFPYSSHASAPCPSSTAPPLSYLSQHSGHSLRDDEDYRPGQVNLGFAQLRAGKLRRPILRSCPAPPVTDLPSTRRESPRHPTLPRPSLHHPHLTTERPARKGSHSPPTSNARPGLRSSSSSHCPVPLQARSTHASLGSSASTSSPSR